VVGGEIPSEKNQEEESCEKGKGRAHLGFSFDYSGDGGFFHLDLHVVSDLHDDRAILYVRDQAVNPGGGDDAIAGF
jgi:hypothetical protein